MLLILVLAAAFGSDAPAVEAPAEAPVQIAVAPPWWADGAPTLEGPLTENDVNTGASTINAHISTCHQAEQSQRPALEGTVALSFKVGSDGVPVDVHASSTTFEDSWFLGCLQSAVSLARFPSARDSTQVHWGTKVAKSRAELTGGIGGLIGNNATQFGTGGPGGGNFGENAGGTGKIGGDPIILGALDKSLIDAVVKRNMNQIRYCYQRELTKNKTLAGKMTVRFVISKDGSVQKAETKSTTLNNVTVESCINGRFMKFQFPEPKGGGIVIVSYPFVFEPG